MRCVFKMVLMWALTVGAAAAWAQGAPGLPKAFAGWVKASNVAPPQITREQASLLQEFRLAGAAQARYEENGNHLDLTVFSFADYTGAYGAFTFWRAPNMLPQSMGDDAASGDDRVIFFTANLLVDAKFDRVSAMTLGQLRELARSLAKSPTPGNPPTLPKFLPKQELQTSTVRYAVGPQGLAQSGAPLNAEQVAFQFSPEIVTAHYTVDSGDALLTIVEYPTPQIAADQLKKIAPGFLSTSRPAQQIKRTYSMLVLTSGEVSAGDAQTLLASVNYEADVTWNQATKQNPKDNVGSLLVNIIVLSGILVAFMFIFGLFFGGFRLLYYRLNPGKAAAREEEQQLIRLNLS